jgi:hypothetical protein
MIEDEENVEIEDSISRDHIVQNMKVIRHEQQR